MKRLNREKKISDFIKSYGIFLVVLLLLFLFCINLQWEIIRLNEELARKDLDLEGSRKDIEDYRYYVHIMEKRFITLGGDVTEWGCKRTRIQNVDNDDEDDDASINRPKLLSEEAMSKIYESKFTPNFDEPSQCIKDEMKAFPLKLMCTKLSYNYRQKYQSPIDDLYLVHDQRSGEADSRDLPAIDAEKGEDVAVDFNTDATISSGLMNFNHFEDVLFKEVLLNGLILAPSFGSAWGDFNKDGFMDLYVGNHYWHPSLYMNVNGTHFVDVSEEMLPESVLGRFLDKHSCAWADFDNDGNLDLLEVTGALYGTSSIPNNFYINPGNGGKFVEDAVKRGLDYPLARGRMVTWLDYNGDGYLDAFLSTQKRNDGEGMSALFEQDPKTHKFRDVTERTGMDVAIKVLFARQTDLDNDGELELFLITFTFPYKVYHVPEDPTQPFKEVTYRYFPFNQTISQAHKEYAGNSTVWVPPPTQSGFYALVSDLVFGDLDEDGYQDIVLARNYNGDCIITVMFNNGPRDLPKESTEKNIITWDTMDIYQSNDTQCGSLAIGDFDNDFHLDIFMVTYLPFSNSPNIYVVNHGDREFSVRLDGFGAGGTVFGKGESVAVADYDNDGLLDLFITNGKGGVPFDIGPNQLFRNVGYNLMASPRYWIEIDLIGKIDNAHGFGSRVFVKACKKTLFREVENGVHFSAQNSFRVHFGLNQCPTITEIKVYWQSTKKFQYLKQIKPNQILTITQEI